MTITQTDLTDIIEKWGNGLIAISAAYEKEELKGPQSPPVHCLNSSMVLNLDRYCLNQH